MAADVKAELRIPDLWFDFYARILPGTAFVAAVRVILQQNSTVPTGSEIVVLVAAGFFCGLITQPIASRFVGFISERAGPPVPNGKTKSAFIEEGRHHLGVNSRQSMVLSKMHGECTFFVQLVVLSVVFLVLQFVRCRATTTVVLLNIGAVCFSFVAAWDVATRRLERLIRKLDSLPTDYNPVEPCS